MMLIVRVVPLCLCLLSPFVVSDPIAYGSGFGRTGTDSLKAALETLGLGPTYHMKEVIGVATFNKAYQESHIDLWAGATDGPPDFDVIFKHYPTGVDAPVYPWFSDLRAAFPKTKVILTKRSSGKAWHKSISEAMCQFTHAGTTLGWLRSTRFFMTAVPKAAKFSKLHDSMDRAGSRSLRSFLQEEHSLARACTDEDYAVRLYDAWNRMVIETTPAEQLLIFETGKHGWKELCAFLGVPEPAVPYPHVNSKAEFQFITRIMWFEVVMVYFVVPGFILLILWYLSSRSSKTKSA